MAKSPNIDFKAMNDEEIRELLEQGRVELNERFSDRTETFRALAREAGFEVLIRKPGEGETRTRRGRPALGEGEDRRGAVKPKYRNPENPSDIWSGRGREPKWMTELLSRGHKREDMLIEKGREGTAEEAKGSETEAA